MVETAAGRRWWWRRAAPLAAVGVLLPLFVALGLWQLQRAEEKQRLQEEYDARAREGLVAVGTNMQSADALQFYRVQARGTYEPAYQILVDNRVHQGRAGYHVVTPFRIEGGPVRLLVNRGWIPLGESRTRLPEIPTPGGVVTVTGVATVPSEKGFRLRAPATGSGWQTVWPYLELKRYGAAVPFAIQPVVVLLDPDSPAGGFTREWTRLDRGVAVHQGYAFQWFALAIALLVLYFLVTRRPGGRGKETASS